MEKPVPGPYCKADDEVPTTPEIAQVIVDHFKPSGKLLEPCRGCGNFYKNLLRYSDDVDWCEIKEGRNYFEYNEKVDWIITGPPWSYTYEFLMHSMELANDIVFFMPIAQLWTNVLIDNIKNNGFGIKELFLTARPTHYIPKYTFGNIPHFVYQLGVVHISKGYEGDIKINL